MDKYQDGKLPILYLKVWIWYDKEGRKKMLCTHCMKEGSTKNVTQMNSAYGERMHQYLLVIDICRVMRNVVRDWNEMMTKRKI